MATSLATLDPQILGLILSYRSVSYASLPLWICGNKSLQRKLSLGVTRVVLKNRLEGEVPSFPSFLIYLRNLRKLSIKRSNLKIRNEHQVWKIVRRLSPTLQRLSLEYRHNRCHFYKDDSETRNTFLDLGALLDSAYQNSSPEASTCSKPTIDVLDASDWTIGAAFPLLSKFKLCGDQLSSSLDIAPLLTPTLTSFDYEFPTRRYIAFEAFIDCLPVSLLRLRLRGIPAELESTTWVSKLPPNLISLTCSFPIASMVETHAVDIARRLPRSITHLNFSLSWGIPLPQLLAPQDFSLLPPAIQSFPLSSTNDLSGSSDCPAILERFESIREFGDDMFSDFELKMDAIPRLPASIRCLHIRTDITDATPNSWPAQLRSLQLVLTGDVIPRNAFPSHLLHLSIEQGTASLNMADISFLPRTLLKLDCPIADLDDETLAFPPNLTVLRSPLAALPTLDPPTIQLHVDGKMLEKELDLSDATHRRLMGLHRKAITALPIHKLPKTLKMLQFPTLLPASQLVHLPPGLQTLHITDFFEDADFDPTDKTLIAAIDNAHRIGCKEGLCSSVLNSSSQPATSPTRASIAGLLPRSLHYLSFDCSSDLPNFDWERLPERLTSLCMNSAEPMDAHFLLVAPLKYLKICVANVKEVKDEHIKALPRRMDYLPSSAVGDTSQLTLRAVLHLPPGLHPSTIAESPSSNYELGHKLLLKRKASLNDCDFKAYDRYTSFDETLITELMRPKRGSNSLGTWSSNSYWNE